MEGQLFTLAYGACNYRDGSGSYTAFKVTPPFTRVQAVAAGAKEGRPENIPAGNLEMHKGFARCQVRYPNGTIILVQMTRKRSGSVVADGALFLRLRAGAALISVRAKLPISIDNIIGENILVFQAYADILSEEELDFVGIEPERSYVRRYMELDEVSECFSVTEVSPQREAPPRIQEVYGSQGVVQVEAASEPMRRLRIRRR